MVLSTSTPDHQPGQDAWLDGITATLDLVDAGVLVLAVSPQPARMGALVKRLWRRDPNVIVTPRIGDLLDAPHGSTVVLCPNVAQSHALNLQRTVFSRRALRTVVFCTPADAGVMAREAPDFFSWISHRVEAPDGPPPHALQGLRLAFCRRARLIAWPSEQLEPTFEVAFPNRRMVQVNVADCSYAELVDAATPRPRQWVAWHNVASTVHLRRLRWALGQAGRRGRSLLCSPYPDLTSSEEAIVTVSDELLPFQTAWALLQGHSQAGLVAGLLRLESGAVRYAATIIDNGGTLPPITQLATALDPGVIMARAARSQGIRLATADDGSDALDGRAFAPARRWTPSAFDRAASQKRWRQLAAAAWECGDFAMAASWGARWLDAEPGNEARRFVARVQLERWLFSDALSVLGLHDFDFDFDFDNDFDFDSDGDNDGTGLLRARALVGLARYDEAQALISKRETAGDDPRAGEWLTVLAALQRETGLIEEAVATAREAILAVTTHGDALEQLAAFEQYALVALRRGERITPEEHTHMNLVLASLPKHHTTRLSFQLSFPDWSGTASAPRRRDAETMLHTLLGPEAPRLWWVLLHGSLSTDTDDDDRQPLTRLVATLGETHPRVAEALQTQALVMRRSGHFDDARQRYECVLSIYASRHLDSSWLTITSQLGLAELLDDSDRVDEALAIYRRWLPLIDKQPQLLGFSPYANYLEDLAQLERRAGHRERAITLIERGIAQTERDITPARQDSLRDTQRLMRQDLEQLLSLQQRLWFPQGMSQPWDDAGFVLDPSADDSSTPLTPFEQLRAQRYLLLLGDAGMGKSYILEAARIAMSAQLLEGQTLTTLAFAEGDNIREALFADDNFHHWYRDGQQLYLFVDSVGMGPTAAAMLAFIELLHSGPLDQLTLRIAWRTGRCDEEIVRAFSDLEQQANAGATQAPAGIYQLAPLRQSDVVRIAGDHADVFLSDVAARKLAPLARHPALLAQLLRQFKAPSAQPAAPPYDVYFSFHSHADDTNPHVQRLADALKALGLSIYMDARRIDVRANKTSSNIPASAIEGLSQSKLLLAYYTDDYAASPLYQRELTTAQLAAEHEAATSDPSPYDSAPRIVLISPAGTSSAQVYPAALRSAEVASIDNLAAVAMGVLARLQPLHTPMGSLVKVAPPTWLPSGARLHHPDFVGQLPELWQLHALLNKGDDLAKTGAAAAPVVVQGLGGVGKTALVAEYAERFSAAYPGGIVWLRAASADPALDGGLALKRTQLGHIAAELGIVTAGQPPADVETMTWASLRARQQRCLIVVDNLPPGLGADQLRTWIAPSDIGPTLFTTRSRAYGLVGRTITLDALERGNAIRLLSHKPPPDNDAEREAADALCDLLGDHPLALSLLASSLAASADAFPFAAALGRLAKALAKVPNERLEGIVGRLGEAGTPAGHEYAITMTLLDGIEQLGEEGRDVLLLASLGDAAPWPQWLVAKVFATAFKLDEAAADERADAAFAQVAAHAFAELTDAGAGVLVHPLIARTVRSLPEHKDALEPLTSATIAALLDELPAVADARSHHRFEAAVQHARALMDINTAPGRGLLGWIARYEFERGDYAGAARDHRRLLLACRNVLGDEHPDTLTSMNNLAATLRAQGDSSEAREMHEQVLAVTRRVLGDEHPDTLTSMNNLAQTLFAQGDLTGTREMQEQVLLAHLQMLGDEHPRTLTSMNNLAETLFAQGDLTGAKEMEEQVLAVTRRVLGDEHPDTLRTMNNLAQTLFAQGDLTGARGMQEQVLAVRRRVLGDKHPRTLTSMNNLAQTLFAQGDLTGARGMHEQVLTVHRQVLGDEHPHTLTSMNNLAQTLFAQDDLTGTREMQEQVLAVTRRVLGDEHPDTLTSMNNLAATLQSQGELAAAHKLLERALQGFRGVLGEAHPHTLAVKESLVNVRRGMGRPKASESESER